jgi:hypothetical protein
VAPLRYQRVRVMPHKSARGDEKLPALRVPEPTGPGAGSHALYD